MVGTARSRRSTNAHRPRGTCAGASAVPRTTCRHRLPPLHDLMRALARRGQPQDRGSPYSGVLRQSTNGCDPLHLNFIDVVRDDLPAGIEGIEPGDIVVSLRNISAFGIIDAGSGDLKRLVRGTFIQQHSVQHLSGSRYISTIKAAAMTVGHRVCSNWIWRPAPKGRSSQPQPIRTTSARVSRKQPGTCRYRPTGCERS